MESMVTVRFAPSASDYAIDHGGQVFIWIAEFARQGWERLHASTVRPDAIPEFVRLGTCDGCTSHVSGELHAHEVALPILVKVRLLPRHHLTAVNDPLVDA